jgi:hypothetical protein
MKAETIFKIGETVWFMENNHICCGEVLNIYVTFSSGNSPSICMNVSGKDKNTDEAYFYKSKQELIESL